MRLYARQGVGHLWLVDPLAKTLAVYRIQGGDRVVTGRVTDDVADAYRRRLSSSRRMGNTI